MNSSRRFGWIGYCLKTLRRFGVHEKKALSTAYGISESTLSRDQSAFFAAASGESGVRLECGKLRLADADDLELPSDALMPDLDEWLRVMIGSSFTTLPDVARARPSDQTIGAVVRAILERRAIFLFYVSRSAPEPTWRTVSPHAIVDIAGRYHARCFDHAKGRYGNFVLARVVGTNFDRTDLPAYVDGREDQDWHTRVKLRVSIVGAASSPAAMLDYGIVEGRDRILMVRKALAPYVTNHRRGGFEDLMEVNEVRD